MTMHTRDALFLAAAALAMSSCRGCDSEVVKLAPQIAVDACASPDINDKNGIRLGGYRDCVVDFGEADLSVRTERTIRLTNPSGLPLNLQPTPRPDGEVNGIYFLDEGYDPAFTITREPGFDADGLAVDGAQSINPGLSTDLVVSVLPLVESALTTTLVILTDAENTEQNPDGRSEIRVVLQATGVDNGVPDIEVLPANCDFGPVGVGGIKVCELTVRNVGTRELFFSSTTLEQTRPAGSADPAGYRVQGALPSEEQPLAPSGTFTMRVALSPDVLGPYQGTLSIRTNDPDESLVQVPLTGTGSPSPTCTAYVKSVNGDAYEVGDNPQIEPLDDIVVAIQGVAPNPETTIAACHWEFVGRGEGSNLSFVNPDGCETGFVFDGTKIGLDVAGKYVLQGQVTDSLGTINTNDCRLEFDAIPTDSLLVQATWGSSPDSDMDLHMIRRNIDGQYCHGSMGSGTPTAAQLAEPCNGANSDDQDCHFGNRNINWDGDGSNLSEGDPSLDVDDTNGFGPENINIDLALPGSYLFGIANFDGSPDELNFIRLYLFGQLAGEWSQSLSAEWFEPGVVHWPTTEGARPCLEDLLDGDPSDDCSCADGPVTGLGLCSCWESNRTQTIECP
jgi:hypothetical protein